MNLVIIADHTVQNGSGKLVQLTTTCHICACVTSYLAVVVFSCALLGDLAKLEWLLLHSSLR